MPTSSPQEVTQLLCAWREGSQTAFEQLMPLVYDELRRLAHRHLKKQPPGHTLQTTDLVHEAYLRLLNQPQIECQNRAHFFAIAARAMRFILVDWARARQSAKRGGRILRVTLDETTAVSTESIEEMLAIDEALARLATLDPRQSQIVEMRYFGGLTVEETAEVLGISSIKVRREWDKARAWLYRELSPGQEQIDDA